MAKLQNRRKGFKESWRKTLVSLKKRPHNIPLVMMVITFLVFSLNLTKVSNTTAVVNKQPMGLCAFIVMLFSILAFVSFLNAYPKRQKPRIAMVVILYVLLVACIVSDFIYLTKINEGLATIQINNARLFIPQCKTVLTIHIIMLIICLILIITIPVYGKLLNKIDTSVKLEGNEDIKIELADDDSTK